MTLGPGPTSVIVPPRRWWVGDRVFWRVEIGISRVDVGDPGDSPFGVWDGSNWAPDPGDPPNDGVWGGFFVAWYDITPWVLDVQTSAGRDRYDQRVRPGTARVVLENSSGLWNPISGTLPNTFRMRPGRAIRVSVNAEEGWVNIFTGFVDTIDETYRGAGYDIASILDATDPSGLLAIDNPPALETPRPIELTSERVQWELDEFGWPFYELDTGLHRMRSSTVGQSRFEECQRAADAEGGAFYFDGDGTAIFRNRDAFPPDAPVDDFIGGPAGLPVIQADVEWSNNIITNDAQYSAVDGTVVREVNTASQSLYGNRTARRYDLQCEDQSAVQFLAQRIVTRRAFDRLRVNSVTVQPFTRDEARRAIALTLGSKVSVTVALRGGEWSYTTEAVIQGVSHRVDADDWTVTYRVEDITASSPPSGAFDGEAFDDGFDVEG